MTFKQLQHVTFPRPQGRWINMMPIIFGEVRSIPDELLPYLPMIDACHGLRKESVVYVSVRESYQKPGTYQSRPGVHTEGFRVEQARVGWGGGGWGAGTVVPVTVPIGWGGTPQTMALHSAACAWGGGGWGGPNGSGLFMASTDGRCDLWNCEDWRGDRMGALPEVPRSEPHEMEPHRLYWLTDRTPHRALPSRGGMRQWFRLVSEHVDVWYSKHNTPNPLGVAPSCRIVDVDKFAGG